MVATRRPKGAHLLGSIPLGDVETVFRTVSSDLGQHLERMPDGELGARAVWIAWQYPVLARLPGLEEVPPDPGAYVQRPPETIPEILRIHGAVAASPPRTSGLLIDLICSVHLILRCRKSKDG